MFVDASALVAILTDEAEARRLSAEIDAADGMFTSPLAVFETVTAVVRRKTLPVEVARTTVKALLSRAGIQVRPVDGGIGDLALDAHARYGKGRGHPAQLNFGDCFSYAIAKAAGVRLLCVGSDFSRTDLA